MATIKIVIKSSKKKQPATMWIRFRNGRETDLMIPTEFKIYPEYWNNVSQSFRQRASFDDEKAKAKLNKGIQKLKDEILTYLNDNGSIDKDGLTDLVYEFHHPKIKKEAIPLNQFIEKYIKEAESGIMLTQKKTRFAYSTIRVLKGFKNQFEQFQEETKKQLNYKDITIDFYNEFIKYFNEKNYSQNTIGRHIRHLKMIMRASLDKGYHNSIEFTRKAFRDFRIETESIYLNEDELQKMFEKDLSDKPLLDLARNVFLVGCYTAQRFSDYSMINKNNFKTLKDGTKVISLIQKKTGEKVIIPIRPELDQILKKYDYSLPKTYEQKINKSIKEVGKELKINEPVTTEHIKGGLKVKTTIPKYKMIKTHTARRSGCSNMYLAGIPTIAIMKISGHKTETEFLKYIKVGKEETASKMASHSYFKGSNLKIAR